MFKFMNSFIFTLHRVTLVDPNTILEENSKLFGEGAPYYMQLEVASVQEGNST